MTCEVHNKLIVSVQNFWYAACTFYRPVNLVLIDALPVKIIFFQSMLIYNPDNRIPCIKALGSSYFKDVGLVLPAQMRHHTRGY